MMVEGGGVPVVVECSEVEVRLGAHAGVCALRGIPRRACVCAQVRACVCACLRVRVAGDPAACVRRCACARVRVDVWVWVEASALRGIREAAGLKRSPA